METLPNGGLRRHPVSVARGAMERLSRGIILKRRLPERVGGREIWLSPEASSLRAWRSDLEWIGKDLFDAAQELVSYGDCVWDIGANVGLFAFSAAYFAGKQGCVVAIEPDIFSASLLRRTSNHPHPESALVTVIPVAVAESTRLSRFHIAQRARSSNFIDGFGFTQANGSRELQIVPTFTLDWLAVQLDNSPNVLKIDVEGAERLVLLGAEELIRHARPKIYIEVAECNVEWISEFFDKHRYRLFDGDIASAKREPLSSAVWNTIAFPT